jgi:hypothetical protein
MSEQKKTPEPKPCPFCGGKGKVTFKNLRLIGKNMRGDKLLIYRVQVICNRCKSRGKPVKTDALLNPHPYISKWGNVYTESSAVCKEQTELFEPFVKQAVEAWNRRASE